MHPEHSIRLDTNLNPGRYVDADREIKTPIRLVEPTLQPKSYISQYEFEQAEEPEVSYFEAFRFYAWSIMLMLSQLWNDIKEGRNGFRSIFLADLLSHFFFIPVGRFTPRLVVKAPHEHLSVRVIPDSTTRQYEELLDFEKFPTKDIINCASNNYGGFSKLEDESEKLIERTIADLPFTDGPAELEITLRKDCAKYMGFEACELAPSGFSSNVLAFRSVYNLAQSYGKKCIFLCDRDCHNSMFTGAYNNKNASTHKFGHNDIADLERKLRNLKQKEPNAFVCVAVEGIYSMEGTSAPIPAIVALKKVYGFKLLVDEAHSFMALGSAGRGSFNYWQDAGYNVSLEDADIMTCMFSKSVGCTGGMVLANRDFAKQLTIEGRIVAERGSERLSTAVIVRVLSIIRKPLLIRRRMEIVHAKAAYAAHILSRAGCKILSAPGSPIICFPVGTAQQVAHLHDASFKRGVAFSAGMPPATPIWGCRIRLCIFASLSWADLYFALFTVIDICVERGIPGVKKVTFSPKTLPEDKGPSDIEAEANAVVEKELIEFITTLSKDATSSRNAIGSHPEVIEAGIAALRNYSIGPCSARWFYGSFDVFIKLEQRLAHIYPSLVKHEGRCRGMVCGDAEVTIGSSFAARAAVPRSKAIENLVLVQRDAPHFVHEGVNLAKSSTTRRLIPFDTVSDVKEILAEARTQSKRTAYLTIYLDVVDKTGKPIDIIPLLEHIGELKSTELAGVCVFLDDRKGLGTLGPKKLGYLNHMESIHGDDFFANKLGSRSSDVQVLVAGSWYNSFGHQGGYVTGSANVVENLTWDARAFFFSTPPMPLQTAMSDKALEVLDRGMA